MTTSPTGNIWAGTQVHAPLLDPGAGWVTVPTSASAALATPVRALMVTTAGNLAVKLADGSNNNSQVIAVTVTGQPIPLLVTQLTSNNTAAVLGIR